MSRQVPWARVLAEGFVIVGSILLAFGIDAWWDGQKEAELEQGYAARIAADLRETRTEIDQNAQHYASLLGHGQAVLPILDGTEAIPEDALGFLASVLQASRITAPVVARGAYDDLISTGNLRLLQSDTLRHELSRFYGNVEVRLDPVDYSGDQKPYRTVVRGIIPTELQILIRERCLDAEPLHCDDGPVPSGAAEVAEVFVSEPGLVRKLTISMQAKAVRIGFLLDRAGFSGGFGVVSAEIDDLLTLLDVEYGI